MRGYRSVPDPLATVKEPRWLVVRDVCNRPLRHIQLQPNADLRAALEAERQRMITDGLSKCLGDDQQRRVVAAESVVLCVCGRIPPKWTLAAHPGRAYGRVYGTPSPAPSKSASSATRCSRGSTGAC